MSTVPPSAPAPPGTVRCRTVAEFEAVRLTRECDWQAVTAWCGGQYVPSAGRAEDVYPEAGQRISVLTGTRIMPAYAGDWIVRRSAFLVEVCKPAEFAGWYEITGAVKSGD